MPYNFSLLVNRKFLVKFFNLIFQFIQYVKECGGILQCYWISSLGIFDNPSDLKVVFDQQD